MKHKSWNRQRVCSRALEYEGNSHFALKLNWLSACALCVTGNINSCVTPIPLLENIVWESFSQKRERKYCSRQLILSTSSIGRCPSMGEKTPGEGEDRRNVECFLTNSLKLVCTGTRKAINTLKLNATEVHHGRNCQVGWETTPLISTSDGLHQLWAPLSSCVPVPNVPYTALGLSSIIHSFLSKAFLAQRIAFRWQQTDFFKMLQDLKNRQVHCQGISLEKFNIGMPRSVSKLIRFPFPTK